MKKIICAALLSGAMLSFAPAANAAVGISLNLGNVGIAYSDGYYDHYHHWHYWRPGEWYRWRRYHPGHYYNWRHNDRHHGWHHTWHHDRDHHWHH